MVNGIAKEESALLRRASEMFHETGCVPGFYGEEVPAKKIVPDAKEYISGAIDDPEAIYGPEIWDAPGFALVLSWLAQKWHQKCHNLVHRRSKNPEQHLTKAQQKACLDAVGTSPTLCASNPAFDDWRRRPVLQRQRRKGWKR
jgi:hypothetical protein